MDTRDRLIDSTRELLWERGYVGTSPKAIQQRAGAGQGSMYHHFTGKPDLALAAVRRSAEELRAAAGEQLRGPGTALERITAYLRREREVLRGCPIGRLAADPDIVASAVLRQPLADTFSSVRGELADVLRAGQAAGEFAGFDPEATAATILAVLQGGYVLARAAGSVEPFDLASTGILDLLGRS